MRHDDDRMITVLVTWITLAKLSSRGTSSWRTVERDGLRELRGGLLNQLRTSTDSARRAEAARLLAAGGGEISDTDPAEGADTSKDGAATLPSAPADVVFPAAVETLRIEVEDLLQSDDTSDIERGFLGSFLVDLNHLADLIDRFELREEAERAIGRLEQVRATFSKSTNGSVEAVSLMNGLDAVISRAHDVAQGLPVG